MLEQNSVLYVVHTGIEMDNGEAAPKKKRKPAAKTVVAKKAVMGRLVVVDSGKTTELDHSGLKRSKRNVRRPSKFLEYVPPTVNKPRSDKVRSTILPSWNFFTSSILQIE